MAAPKAPKAPAEMKPAADPSVDPQLKTEVHTAFKEAKTEVRTGNVVSEPGGPEASGHSHPNP